jgi:hypothetical protein
MINAIGRVLPGHVDGYGRVVPFAGAFAARLTSRQHVPLVKAVRPGESKRVSDIGCPFGLAQRARGSTEVGILLQAPDGFDRLEVDLAHARGPPVGLVF